jgi:YidC/Oxa1 family membrane protein insertase
VHYTRNMQKMQPRIQKLREKYKDDRAELNRQMVKLQQEEGFNPLSGCLPMFLQIPVFLGLYHVLRHLSNSNPACQLLAQGQHLHAAHASRLSLYTFSQAQTCDASQAQIFKAPLAASFHDSSATITQLAGDPTSTRWVLIVLLIISAAATLCTQLLVRASASTPPEGTAATVQRQVLWIIPVGVLASGLLFDFPLGVLLYWFTSNLWTLAQQAYIIRYHPPTEESGSPPGALPHGPQGGDGETGSHSAPHRKPRVGQRPDAQRRSTARSARRTRSRRPLLIGQITWIRHAAHRDDQQRGGNWDTPSKRVPT